MGNLRSVAKALEAVGARVSVSTKQEDLRTADRIVLPGQGAFRDCIANLRATGLVDALTQEVRQKGKPFLGICLGLQLLADVSCENGGTFAAAIQQDNVFAVQFHPEKSQEVGLGLLRNFLNWKI